MARFKPDTYQIRLVAKSQHQDFEPTITLDREASGQLGRLLWLLALNGSQSKASADAAALLLRELERENTEHGDTP